MAPGKVLRPSGVAQLSSQPATTFNAQSAYGDAGRFAAAVNVAYEMVSGFTITPEVSYTEWNDKLSVLDGKDAW